VPVIIKSPIDVVVRVFQKKEDPKKSTRKSQSKSGSKKKSNRNANTALFTDEDLIRKATKQERQTIPPKDLFNFIDALDAYEVEKDLEETLVVDVTEITNDGLVVIHIEPKKMIQYNDIHGHLEAMLMNAFKLAKMKDYEYEIKKILFRIYKAGQPSSVVDDLKELKEKVDELWESEFGDEMKSYV
jgi:hypothetical protein